jgi:hypothetical protein
MTDPYIEAPKDMVHLLVPFGSSANIVPVESYVGMYIVPSLPIAGIPWTGIPNRVCQSCAADTGSILKSVPVSVPI